MKDKVLSLLGLCMKAGRVASGEFMTETSIKSGEACIVIVARDASDNTKKNFKDMCSFYHVDYYEYESKEKLGSAIGKEFRASLAVCDEGFAKALKKHLDITEI